jgi:nucleotide-binding universal stress UspA family protein
MSFNYTFTLLSTMLFKNILVPFDLSNKSFHSFKIAIDLAKKYDSKITILTCIQIDGWHHKFYDSRSDDELFKKQKKLITTYIGKLEALANKSNISMKSQILRSVSVVNDITTFAKSRKFDLIVMGSHGRTGIDKLILGSVANGVVQKSSCPVLIIK